MGKTVAIKADRLPPRRQQKELRVIIHGFPSKSNSCPCRDSVSQSSTFSLAALLPHFPVWKRLARRFRDLLFPEAEAAPEVFLLAAERAGSPVD